MTNRYLKFLGNKNEVEDFYQLSEKNKMQNGLFKIDRANIKSAIIYGIVAIAIAFVLSVAETVFKAGTFIGINWANVVDQGAVAGLGVFIAGVSIVKNFLTTNKGNFLGAIKVIPDTE